MCHLSPTVHLAWAILSCGLTVILIQHLWRYDRFKCLKWHGGRQPGAFKRVMTYSYCASVPLLTLYSVTMAVFKYKYGYTFIQGHGIVPTPFELWHHNDRAFLTPLYIIFSVVWGLELVTHLEELTFWLFLLHQGPTRREWFSSIEFKAWAILSVLAIAGMPLVAIFTRSNPLKAEAYIFLTGGAASTLITTVFFIVLFKFPAFLRRVKKEGAAGPVVLRLVKFHELNILRVIFRLLFTIPLLVLGIDGVLDHHTLNESALWSDLFAFIGAVGTVVSSTLTLLIFFPRSLAEDSNWRPLTTQSQSHGSFTSGGASPRAGQARPVSNAKPSFRADAEAAQNPFSHPGDKSPNTPGSTHPILSKSKSKYYSGHFTSPSALTTTYYPPSLQNDPNTGSDWELRDMEEADAEENSGSKAAWRGSGSEAGLTSYVDAKPGTVERDGRYGNSNAQDEPPSETHLKVRMIELGQAVDAGLKKPVRPPRLHPYIMSFTSPIDLLQCDDDSAPRAI